MKKPPGEETMTTMPQRLSLSAAAVLTLAALAVAGPRQVSAQTAPPDFSFKGTAGWLATTGDFVPVPGAPGAGPMKSDPRHPYVPNGVGRQPTYRIADLTHPSLKPWIKERMQK